MLFFRVQNEDQDFMEELLQGYPGFNKNIQQKFAGSDNYKDYALSFGPAVISSLPTIFSAIISHFKNKKDPTFEIDFHFLDGKVEAILKGFNLKHMDDCEKAIEYIVDKLKELNKKDVDTQST